MAPTHGGPGHPLIEVLREESRRFGFSDAAVLLRRVLAEGERDGRRPRDGVRFLSDPSLAFPSSDVEWREVGEPPAPSMTLAFLGLTGTMGVLPAHYSELVQQRLRAGDDTLQRFLGTFHNRIGRQFLQAHLKHRYWLAFAWDLPQRSEPDDLSRMALAGRRPFEDALFGLMGLGVASLRRDAGLLPLGLLHYAGILGMRPRPPSAVAAVLSDVFGVPARIEPFLGEWVDIPPEECSALGREGRAEVSLSLHLGDRFFDPSRGFRIHLGPMGLARLQELLPGASGADVVAGFVPYAVGPDEPFDYTLQLANDEVPDARLTLDADAPQRLGHTLWLFSGDDEGGARHGPIVSGPFRPAAPAHTNRGTEPWSKSA